mmetsp:Transcript_5366/g.18052  ORF Transcript_5366/g.18052 Transcript_5366/m.18052 type:complete len:246 (+) Transcript_5366:1066-1803(+)
MYALAASLKSMLLTLGAAMHTHAHAAILRNTSSCSATSIADSRRRLIAAANLTSSSSLWSNMATQAATPPPMLWPVTSNVNVGCFASDVASAGAMRFNTCHADATIPACAQPPKNGTLELLTSVNASCASHVPRIESTTTPSAASTATNALGENSVPVQSASIISVGAIPALFAHASVALACAIARSFDDAPPISDALARLVSFSRNEASPSAALAVPYAPIACFTATRTRDKSSSLGTSGRMCG